MSSNEGTVVCPLCQSKVSSVGGEDTLQLHYLTDCSGYDKVSNETPRSKITSQTGSSSSSSAYLNTTGSASVTSSSATAAASPSLHTPGSASATIGGSPSGADSVVATGGGPGESTCSVQFMWQPLSDIRYPSITLLASFKGGSVELKIDPDGGHYASRFTSIPKGTYEGQLVIGDSFMHPVKKFTIEKDDDIVVLQFEVADAGGRSGGDLDTGYGDHYGSGYMQRNPSYNQGSTRSSYSYTNPAFGHGNSSGQRGFANEGSSSAYRDRYGYSAYGQPTLDSASENAHGSSQYSKPSTHSSSTVKSKNAEHHLSDTANVSQHYNDINISPLSTSQSSVQGARSKDRDSGFSARQLRQDRSEGAQDQQLREVRAQLEAVTQEKNELLLSQERVNAQWEGRVKRLERQIEAYNKGEKPAESDTEASLRDARTTIAELERQMATLRRQKAEESQSARESQDLRKQLNEMKDRNTALEQQMMEYSSTIQDQAKVIQSLKGGGSSGDAAVMQQLLHKQQVEYSEAIATLRKRIDYADKVAQENTETHQTNVKLAGELEDYRSQTKRLIHDIQQKDEEMAALRQALAKRPSSTNEAMSLELATLKQKLSAWQKEVEKLAPFQQKIEQLDGELAQMKSNNVELYLQMQQLENDVEKGRHELAEKVSDYNTLSERFAELQQTRVNLENELQPLREERARILRENAHLLEGSDPKKYANLKKDHEALKTHCKQLEQALQEQSNLLSAHQESNVEMQQQLDKATDPERLQSIRSRMERYKQERDQARSRLEEAEMQLTKHRSEHEMLKSKLQEVSDQSQGLVGDLQQQMAQHEKILHKVAEYEKRMRRYREERNQANDHIRLLRRQIGTLEGAINDLLAQTGQEDTASYLQSLTGDFESMGVGGVEDASEQEPVPKDFPSGSPGADDYHPQLYSADEDQCEHGSHKEWETESPPNQEARLQVGEDTADREQSYSLEVKGSLGAPKSNVRMVEVQTKEGIAHMKIQKPHAPLNAKEKPTVIVKKGDSYEVGTLMYVGSPGGKEIAGVQMNIRQSKPSGTTTSTDGTYSKDGKRYFKCPTGFGLYVPVSKIFVKSVGSDVI